MSKFDRSWQLFKASLKVMGQHRKLLIFPFIVTGAVLAAVALFLIPIGAPNTGQSYFSFGHWFSALSRFFESGNGRGSAGQGGTRALVYFAIYYFVTMG